MRDARYNGPKIKIFADSICPLHILAHGNGFQYTTHYEIGEALRVIHQFDTRFDFAQ